MKPVEAQLGTWNIAGEVLTGILSHAAGAVYTQASCLAGSEEDNDYIVEATVKLAAGDNASIIAFFTYALDFTESLVECVLDVTDQTLHIDLVNGPTRVVVAYREFALALGAEYNVKVHAKKESDGTGTVTFAVNGVDQLVIEDLATLFTAGLYGFTLAGTLDTNNATFSNVQKYSLANIYSSLDATKKILLLTDELENEEVAQCLLQAKALVDGKLAAKTLTASSTDENIKSASAYYAAWLYRKSRDPVGADAFLKEADAWLTVYIGGSPSASVGFGVGEAE